MMNKRIRELAHQARQIGEYGNYGQIQLSPAQFEQKFAELIVAECAELTLDHKNDDYYAGWLDYRDEIRKHFGVGL
jgi:hypothetical protein